MPKLITICLIPESQEQLEQIRDTDKCPYMRERATAILKIAGWHAEVTGLILLSMG